MTLRTPRTSLSFLVSGAILLAGFLAACDGANISHEGVEDTVRTPQGRFEPDIDDPDRETIFGSGGINSLLSGSASEGPGGGLGVNAFLWRASLDTLAFLPPLSADPFGGVIIYDWYRPPESPEERLKVAVYILDTRLTASALRVAVNRQVQGADGWQDAVASEDTATALENAILTQARLLRIAWLGE